MKIILTAAFVWALSFANAQTINPSIDNIRWGEQNGMSTVHEFESSATTSSWLSLNVDGELKSTATCNGITGTVDIKKSGSVITIERDFAQTDKLTPHIILTVNSFSKI